jgi:hypothetical protein
MPKILQKKDLLVFLSLGAVMAGLIKTTIRVREDLFLKFRVLASVRGKTFSGALNEAIKEYIQNHEEEMKRRLNEVVGTP